MAFLSDAPKPIQGALMAFRLPDPTPQVIAFQYNPQSLMRTLAAQSQGGGEGAQGEAYRLTGPPIETIKLDAEIDAVDQLDAGSTIAAENGIYPQLALLELLVYPSSATVLANTAPLAAGTIEIIPVQAPFVLFVWGPKRVVPVRITDFSITEEQYDPKLNPVRAKVSLGLRVLSYNDLARTSPGYTLFQAHHAAKEALARIANRQALSTVKGGQSSLF